MIRTRNLVFYLVEIVLVVLTGAGCGNITRAPESLEDLYRTKMEMLASKSVSPSDKDAIEDELLKSRAEHVLLRVMIEYWEDMRCGPVAEVPSGEPGDTYVRVMAEVARDLFYQFTHWGGLETRAEMEQWWRDHSKMPLRDIIEECKKYK